MDRRRALVLLSPLVLVGLGWSVEKLTGPRLGAWAFVPAMLVFWAFIAAAVVWGSRRPVGEWLRRPRGSWMWPVLAVLVGLLSVRELLAGWRVLQAPLVAALWLLFALVNPWMEEGYWRGLLIDAAEGWKGLGVLYSSVVFALSHPLIWGVNSPATAHPAALIGVFVVGLVWGLAYWRTGSLRFNLIGHACADLFSLAVPVMLNLHVPAGLK